MHLSLLVVLFAFTTSSHALSASNPYKMFPVLQCPAVGDEYSKMIGKLEVIKTSVKDKANCKAVTTQVDTLEQLLETDRQKVLGIVDKADGQPLAPADAKLVRDYAQALTQRVATLNDLFTNGNQCFSEDGSDKSLSALAGFVNEAASLVGSVAGPYGAPIALAGNVIAGFMTGLDQVLKSRAGYDFSKRDQWLSYVQNLCTYNSYREQIDQMLNPASHLAALNLLRSKLTLSLNVIAQVCDDCHEIQTNFAQLRPAFVGLDGAGTIQTFVSAADQKYSAPLGSYTVQYLGLLDWVNSEIARIEKDVQSDWGNVSGQYLLARAKDQIEDFLVTRSAPDFLAFQFQQGQNQFDAFKLYAREDGGTLYNHLIEASKQTIPSPLKSWVAFSDPLDVFRKLMIQPVHWDAIASTERADDLKAEWQSFGDESLLKLNSAQTTTRVGMAFCSFFRNSKQYGEAIRQRCMDSGTLRLVQAQTGIRAELAAAQAASPESEFPTHAFVEDVTMTTPKSGYALTRLQSLIKTIDARIPNLR